MAKIPSVTSHTFSEVPKAMISRSSFDRSHGHKTTFDASYLLPIFVDEGLPGDTFNLNMTGFARMATPIKPVMDNLFMETFFFAVPNRLLWDNWETFITTDPGADPDNPVTPSVPTLEIPAGSLNSGSLPDYFGIPINSDAKVIVNALPFRAYNLIYNEWFRDQNLVPERTVETGDTGDDIINDEYASPARRCKRHDYFTSCLPWPQKGEEVTIPTLGTAPVVSAGDGVPVFKPVGGVINSRLGMQTGAPDVDWTSSGSPDATGFARWHFPSLETDLSQATATSINDLRIAFQLQKMLERDARGGTRYTETIHAHFGVTSPDARLQRPEYLGGGRTRINVIRYSRQHQQTRQLHRAISRPMAPPLL